MTPTPHIYGAFGLTVHSDVELPSLPPGSGGPRVDVHMGPPVSQTEAGTGPPAFSAGMERMWRSGAGWLLRYEDPRSEETWTMRVAAGGGAVDVERTEGIVQRDLLEIVQTVGLASALQLRGVLLLHACVLEIGGAAVLVLGASGSGKSTTGAALVRHGLALLSDDIAAVEVAGDALVVHPGLRRMRVTSDTARAMGWDPDTLTRVFDTPLLGDKRGVEVSVAGGSFCAEARPVAAIIVLGPRTTAAAAQLETLPPSDALAVLRANGYRDALLDRAQHAWRFPLIARLAHEVPVHAVRARDDHAALPELVEVLLGEVRSPC